MGHYLSEMEDGGCNCYREITRLSSELAASRERERALEGECEASMVTIAIERRDREAAEAEVKRLKGVLSHLAPDAETLARAECQVAGYDPASLLAVESGPLMSAWKHFLPGGALADANTQGG